MIQPETATEPSGYDIPRDGMAGCLTAMYREQSIAASDTGWGAMSDGSPHALAGQWRSCMTGLQQ